MLKDFKSQVIVWDKANRQLYEKIEGHQGDSNGRQLVVQILNCGATVSIPNATLNLAWKSNENKGFDVFEVVDSSKAIYKLTYTTELLSNRGKVKASLVLVDTERRIESKPFDIHLIETVVDDDSIQSEDSFTALTQALIRVEKIEASEDERQVTFERNESIREATFESNESDRIKDFESNESDRINTFEHNETKRQEDEVIRVENEHDRVKNEENRVKTEQERITTEATRVENENERKTNETNRESAENDRFEAERERKSNETIRLDNELERVTNENTRQINESERIEAEVERDLKYTQIESDYADRAETLEQTYAPRLTNVENEIANKNNFDERITIIADTTSEADVGYLRFLRGDESVLGLVATSDNGTGLNLHLYDGEEWTGLVKINENGDLYTTGTIRAEGGII